MDEKKIVYYSEFGAVGDGVTEDIEAIKRCHDYANENGCTVKADPGAKYYVAETEGNRPIIKTDVDWGDATFIINDKIIPVESKSRMGGVFVVERDYPVKTYDEESDLVKAINAKGGINADEAKDLGYAPGYPVMLIIHNVKTGAYNRYGCHATGKPNPQRELVVLDKDGNIDPKTKLLLNYDYVTSIDEYRIDDKPITIMNGKFITIANCAPPVYTSYARGIKVQRSNVKIINTQHEVTDEGPHGAPCGSFFSHNIANNVFYENLRVQSHKSYKDYEYDENGKVIKVHSTMGSYDIGGQFGNDITYYKCIQTNFWKWEEKQIAYNEGERWGVMGSNYNKNITFDSSILSRFDAHAGIYNVVIKNTLMSYIKLTGGGTAIIENSKIVAPEGLEIPFLQLRSDYGSTWKGEIVIKDCEFVNWKGKDVFIVSAGWANWSFGYITHLPKITIDNLKIDKPVETIHVFNKVSHQDQTLRIDESVLNDGTENKNPMFIATNITVKNNDGGYNYKACINEYVNSKMTLINE